MSFDRVCRLNGLARQTRALPYDQRSFHLFENRDEVHGLGVDPGVLQDFDPTDEALDEIVTVTAAAGSSASAAGLRGLQSPSPTNLSDALVNCPVPTPANVTSDFGLRVDPISGKNAGHNGVDLRNPRGSPVFATQDGTIARVYSDPAGGSSIIVQNADGSRSGYAHSKAQVEAGASVRSGDRIGYSDGSGRHITKPHLHYTFTPSPGAAKIDPLTQIGLVCRTR